MQIRNAASDFLEEITNNIRLGLRGSEQEITQKKAGQCPSQWSGREIEHSDILQSAKSLFPAAKTMWVVRDTSSSQILA